MAYNSTILHNSKRSKTENQRGVEMKAPKNFMKFPYNLLKKATISDCIYNKGEFTVDITIKDTWLLKLINKYEE